MKIRTILICICTGALLAGPGLVSSLRAQSDQPRVENRLLLVFDISSGMKKRVPSEAKSVNELFDVTLNGHMRRGDSIGVWTFSQDLHMGQFPQLEWNDDEVNSLPPELAAFLQKQRYAKETRFDALIPTLNEVVRTSPRLTTLIFCDGDGQVDGIPGADSINATFKQHHHQMEKAHMPFVIVLRSQFDRNQVGHFVACTISSAESVSLPQFPPFPMPPPPPVPAPVKTAPPPPAPVVPPLIIIGTNSGNNQAPVTPQTAPPERQSAPEIPPQASPISPARPMPPAATATPPLTVPTTPIAQTNSAPPPTATIQPTNQPAISSIQPASPVVLAPQAPVRLSPPPVAATLPRAERSGASNHRILAAGAGLIIVVAAIIYIFLRRSRSQDSASLISESLKKR